jgi:hypothetical protein
MLMSQTLKLEVPEALFHAIEREAAEQGSDPAAVAVSTLHRHFQERETTSKDPSAGLAFHALFGAETEAPVTGLDNEAIDADLAKEYARGMTN